MKFSLSWLKEHLATDATASDIAAKLNAIGLEVEGIDNPAEKLSAFRIARVLSAAPHPQADKLQVLFVTVDPERDTPQVLKGYMANFDPSFLALRGTPEQLAAMAKEFKVYYKKTEGKTPTSYGMDHSAASYVYDQQGRLRLYTRYGSGPQGLVSDLQLLLKG